MSERRNKRDDSNQRRHNRDGVASPGNGKGADYSIADSSPTDRYRVLFEAANDAIFIMRGTEFLDCNDRTLQMLGVSGKEDLAGRFPWESAPPVQPDGTDSRQKAEDAVKAAYDGKPQVFRYRHHRSDGTLFDTEVSLNAFQDQGETLILAITRDITEQMKAEERLRLSEEKFAKVFRFSPDSITISRLSDSVILDANTGFERLTGLRREDVIGKSALDLGLWRDKSDREIMRIEIKSEGYIRDHETDFRLPSGELLHCMLSAETIEYAGEKCVVMVIRDVTERRVARQALEASEAKYRTLIEATGTGFVIFDSHGTVLDANPEYVRLTGHSDLDDILGRRVFEWTAEYDMVRNREALADCLNEGQLRNFEVDYVDQDGAIMPIEASATRQEKDGETRIVALCRDISRRRHVAETLKAERDRAERYLQVAQVILLALDVEGNIMLINRKGCQILGYEESELIGRNWYDLDTRPREETGYGRFLQIMAGQLDPREHYRSSAWTKEGEERLVAWHDTLLHDDNGRIVGMLSSGEDITERKQAEDEVAQLKALLAAAIEQSPTGILIAEAPDVRILVANSAALGIRGGDEAYLTEIPVELHPEHWQVYRPDGSLFTPEELPLSRAILEGIVCRNVEARIRRNDGSERWVMANAAPVRNAAGEVVAGVVVFPDVTEVKRAESVLKSLIKSTAVSSSRKFYSSLVRHIAQGLDFRFALIGELIGEKKDRVRSLAFWDGEKIGAEMEYDLTDSPCADVVGKKPCVIYSGVSERWPRCRELTQLKIESYIGMPLRNSSGDSIGILGIMDDRPLSADKANMAESLLTVFAVRAEAEYERMRADEELRVANEQLKVEHTALAEKNIALREILSHMEQEKDAYRQELCEHVDQLFAPFVEKLDRTDGKLSERDLTLLKSSLDSIVGKDIDIFRELYTHLSPREMEICEAIREGKSSKEIADLMSISTQTVHKHRETIRKKLRIQNRDINLSAYLRYKH